jgi:hypothetical protein
VKCAAERFRYAAPPDNAREALSALLCPSINDAHIVCRFMAQFGPELRVMLKVAALLACSNDTGKWLTFERNRTRAERPLAYVDDSCALCMTVRDGDGGRRKVYHFVEADKKEYLVDEQGNGYRDWDELFNKHPGSQTERRFISQFHFQSLDVRRIE